jgi:hypothetical protein
MHRLHIVFATVIFATVALSTVLLAMPARAEELAAAAPKPGAIVWHTDYVDATNQAVQQGKMLFVFFHHPDANNGRKAFETKSLAPSVLESRQDRYVWAKVPVSAQIQVGGRTTRILDHAAFREMRGQQGIAIIDYQSRDKDLYGRVVSEFTFSRSTYFTPKSLAVVLDLPPGTLTQRTMVFAVRTHPEAPASTHGQISRVLAVEAQSHSTHQASLQVQGHHAWDSRFHRINGKLPSSLTAQEVVAESWPNEDLVEACIDCVHSWRQSPGHWSAVSGRQRMFGYDIKRGINGIWYATGIFAR